MNTKRSRLPKRESWGPNERRGRIHEILHLHNSCQGTHAAHTSCRASTECGNPMWVGGAKLRKRKGRGCCYSAYVSRYRSLGITIIHPNLHLTVTLLDRSTGFLHCQVTRFEIIGLFLGCEHLEKMNIRL
jgi:hypothetical protein